MKIIDSYSGKRKFLKGYGRKGKSTLDEYQLMLIEAEKTNGFENEPKQKRLTRAEQKARNFKKIK